MAARVLAVRQPAAGRLAPRPAGDRGTARPAGDGLRAGEVGGRAARERPRVVPTVPLPRRDRRRCPRRAFRPLRAARLRGRGVCLGPGSPTDWRVSRRYRDPVIRTTPFHERLSELNTQSLYTHWQGHLSALRYTDAPKHEYFAVRNSVGVFDTSPLFKYRIYGPDAERLLAGVLVRDIRGCRPGQAHYTVWCDDRGFVMEDGVVFRHSESDFLLTTARPNVGWFADHGRRLRVDIEDVSDDYGILAVQGPRARAALASLAPEVESLPFFAHVQPKIASAPVTLSRTGYTGDLGFEITVEAEHAVDVLDAVLEAGRRHGMRPFGE